MIDQTSIVHFAGRTVSLGGDVVEFDHMCWGKPCSQIAADAAGHTAALAKITKDAKDRGENGLAEQGKYARDKGAEIVDKMNKGEIHRGEASNRMKALIQATRGDGIRPEHIKAMVDAMNMKSNQHFISGQRADDAAHKENDNVKRRALLDKAYNQRKQGVQARNDKEHFQAFHHDPSKKPGLIDRVLDFIDRQLGFSADPTKTVIQAGRIVHLD